VSVNDKLFKREKDGFILVEPTLRKFAYGLSYIRILWIANYGPITSKDIIMDMVGDLKLSSLRKLNRKDYMHVLASKNNYRGTYKVKEDTFVSRIRIDEESYYLGTYKTEEEAHKAYQDITYQLNSLGLKKEEVIGYLNSKINYPLVINGESISLKEASIKYKIETYTIRERVKAGWTLEQAVGLEIKTPKMIAKNSKWGEIFKRKEDRQKKS
jgi:hypothetical protein